MAQKPKRGSPVGSMIVDPDDLTDQPVTVSADDLTDGPAQPTPAPAAQRPVSPPPRGGQDGERMMRGMYGSLGDLPVVKALAGFYEMIKPWDRPSDIVRGPIETARNPKQAVELLTEAIVSAHADQGRKAADSARRALAEPTMGGKMSAAAEASARALATVVPLLGPAAAAVGETIAAGEVSRGIGQAGALLTPIKAARVPKRVPVVPKPFAKANPVAAKAIAYGEEVGVPIDAATATQSPFIRSLQKGVADSLGGAGKAEDVQAAQAQRLAEVGSELARKAHPAGSVSPEQAGQALREGVQRRISEKHTEATAAYERLREIEADPLNAREVTADPHTPAPDTPTYFSTKLNPNADELFAEVLKDAVRQGYKGSKTDLRREFDSKLKSARAAASDQRESMRMASPKTLLSDIRKLGGIDPEWMGQVEEINHLKQRMQKNLGAGVANAIVRAKGNGLGLDDLLDQLKQDGRYNHLNDVDDLMSALESLASKADDIETRGRFDVEGALRVLGVEPGAKWWEAAPEPVTMQLPVDVREAKAALRPIYQQLTRQLPITQQRSSPGLKAIENILNGPDYAPLTQVDTDLGTIKSISRGADLPELRDISQGLAAGAIKKLEAVVRKTAADAQLPAGSSGQLDASAALTKGRSATVAKYKAADVLKKLREEPVQTFQQAVYAKDAGVEQLRAVAKIAPDALPKVGRAFLEDLVTTATKEGKFDNAGTIYTKWQNLGPETKKLLFSGPEGPAYISELDNFFRLARMISENPNPSGTSRVMNAMNVGSYVFTRPMASLLFNRSGVKLLTNGLRMRTPIHGNRARAATATSTLRPQPGGSGPRVPVTAEERKKKDEAQTAAIR